MIGRDLLIAGKTTEIETIVFGGFLLADLKFEPVQLYSTHSADIAPPTGNGEYFAELRDGTDRALQREPIAAERPLVCGGKAPNFWKLDGSIAWREGAVKLLLMKKDIAIRAFQVGPPPELSLQWSAKAVKRSEKHELRMRYSRQSADAYVQLFLEVTATKYLTLALGEPKPAYVIDFSSLPAGQEFRLVAAYTSGLRTVLQRTGRFSIAEKAKSAKSKSSRRATPAG